MSVAQKPVVLVDSCSFHFYRVTATYSWFRRAHPDEFNLELFQKNLVSQYDSCLAKFSKICGVKIDDMILVRDCPREQIWRHQFHPSYKASRVAPIVESDSTRFLAGPNIKYLNALMADRYRCVFRIDGAEADDLVAILVNLFSTIWPKRPIYLVATDSDYTQLLSYPNLKIYSPKGGWTSVESSDPATSLATKVVCGDSSDGIKSVLGKVSYQSALAKSNSLYWLPELTSNDSVLVKLLNNRQLIDMDYVPRAIQDQLINSLPDKLDLPFIPSNFRPMSIQLGLCCLNTKLREQRPPVFCSRTCIIRTVLEKGLDVLRAKIVQNVLDLIKMIHWNAQNGIRVFRISSDLCPHKSNPKTPSYNLDFIQPLLAYAGALARRYKQRLTFHPGQYNVVGTPREHMFQQTCNDLSYHAEVLDRMGCPPDSIMVVHGGGIYGDKRATIQRWIDNYARLPAAVQRRLVLEHCEKCFNVEDCLEVSAATGIPVVFDTHHYECYKILHPKETFKPALEYMPMVVKSWLDRGIKPNFHISEQAEGGRVGKHSDFIKVIPDYLFEAAKMSPYGIDVDIEAKMKEQAIFRLYDKYPDLDPRPKEGEPHYCTFTQPIPKPLQATKTSSTGIKIKLKIKATKKSKPLKLRLKTTTVCECCS